MHARMWDMCAHTVAPPRLCEFPAPPPPHLPLHTSLNHHAWRYICLNKPSLWAPQDIRGFTNLASEWPTEQVGQANNIIAVWLYLEMGAARPGDFRGKGE